MKMLGLLLYSIVEMIIFALCLGFVLVNIWSWFIIASFDAPAIGYLQASGISLPFVYLSMKIHGMSSRVPSGEIDAAALGKALKNSFKILFECASYAGMCYVAGYLIHLVA